jgi:hypothetical protein
MTARALPRLRREPARRRFKTLVYHHVSAHVRTGKKNKLIVDSHKHVPVTGLIFSSLKTDAEFSSTPEITALDQPR